MRGVQIYYKLLAVLTALIILKMTDSDEPLVLTESLL